MTVDLNDYEAVMDVMVKAFLAEAEANGIHGMNEHMARRILRANRIEVAARNVVNWCDEVDADGDELADAIDAMYAALNDEPMRTATVHKDGAP
jgi:hypothetical protein